jgi:tryptophan synthase alpha chain
MADVKTYLQNLKKLKLKNPVLVGFGIKDKQTFEAACENANGAIIGTAFIKALEHDPNVERATKKFLDEIVSR